MASSRRVAQWIRQLDSSYTWTRQRAIVQLAASGDMQAWEPLLNCLKHSSHRTRADACGALVTLGGVLAFEPVAARLHEGDRHVREAAALALGRLDDPRAVELLLPLLTDRVHTVRQAACQALAILGDVRAYEHVVRLLQEGDRRVRAAACRTLGHLRDPRAVELLLERLPLERKFYDVRVAIYSALGQIGDARACELLIARMTEGSPTVRDAVFTALGDIGDARVVLPILERHRYDPGRLSPGAQAALRKLGQGPMLDALDTLLRTGDSGPLYRLEQGSQTLVVPVLLRWTTRQDARLRLAACRVLGDLRATASIPQVAKCLNDPVQAVRETACVALGRMGNAREARKVAARVGDTAPAVRRAALKALEELGQTGLVDAARAMFAGDPDALAALLLAKEEPVTKPLLELLAVTRFDISLQRALISLFQSIWAAQEAMAPRLFCRSCLLRPTPREYRTWLAGRARVLTCRGCGAVLHFAREVREVVAVLDSRETKAVSVRKGIARVCWPQRETLCDFDRVEILAANDYAVERFCMSVGNDLDPYRAKRRRDIPVTVACALSENSLRVLEHIFGTVQKLSN